MTEACPLPTPAERRYGEIQARIRHAMMRKVHAALREATEQAQSEMTTAGLDLPPPSADYFAATLHQNLYCTLCKADPDTFAGGRSEIAAAIIRNSRNIARRYWGLADDAPTARDGAPA